MRYIVNERLQLEVLLRYGFWGSALGNAVGFGVLSAAAVRYPDLRRRRRQVRRCLRLLVFIVSGFAIGLTGVGGLAGLVEAGPAGALLGWSPSLI